MYYLTEEEITTPYVQRLVTKFNGLTPEISLLDLPSEKEIEDYIQSAFKGSYPLYEYDFALDYYRNPSK